MDINATVTSDINATTGRGQQHSEAKKAELMRSNLCFYCKIKGHQAKDCCKKLADHSNYSSHSNNTRESTRVHTAPIMPDIENLDSLTEYMKENMDSFNKETKLDFIGKLMPKDFPKAQN